MGILAPRVRCGDLGGSFHLTGTLTVLDSEYITVATNPIALTFTVRRRLTRSTLHVSKIRPRVGKTVHLRGCVSSNGHRDAHRGLYVQRRAPGGSWHVLVKTFTDEAGCYDESTAFKRRGKRYLRAYVPGTHSRTVDYSTRRTVVAVPRPHEPAAPARSTNYRPGEYCALVDHGRTVGSAYGPLRCSRYSNGAMALEARLVVPDGEL